MQKAAIVILNYNGEETLRKFLPSVIQFSTFPIFVADNASTDGSVALLKSYFPELHLISLDTNYGYAGGYNQALDKVKGRFEYYVLLNSDVEVTANWDVNLVSFLEDKPNVAGVQGKILSFNSPGFFEHAGAAGGFIDRFGYPYCRGRFFDIVEEDHGQYDDEIMVDWISGACMAIRAEIFHASGGFDASYFAHMEEIDWCWRIRKRGYSFRYISTVKVFHVGGATLSHSNPKKTYLNFRNNLATLKKNLSKGQWRIIYSIRIILDILAGFNFLIKGTFRHAFMVYKAHRDLFKMSFDQKNSSNEGIRSNGKVKFLLWTFYIKGKKKYSEA
ncbi:glycosyltransferase family 2 protein [Cecembia rubra]|uniref:glycosyltransferase family 2 protein n=1 Tax=Cecembia rubra TaxID=1485585 RepID=UPI00271528E6|nr:glycosyltransferase family 2 protein [Cecembia rubra]